jgi:phosphoribosylanthranilate isomerase
MFQIKICGITSEADAQAAVEAGADAIGFNFFEGSRRFVERGIARSICRGLDKRVLRVGVFVNAPPPAIRAILELVDLDAVQLHGDESPTWLAELGSIPVVKAFRLGPDGLAPVRAWFEASLRTGGMPQMVLLDAHQPGEFGGTGRPADRGLAAAYGRTPGMPPWALAGGLSAENVAEAIVETRPHAVDTAGGVESAPGKKDHLKMGQFVAAARAAFRSIAG